MKFVWLAGAALLLAVAPAWASDDVPLARMAMCRDSWVDWQKSDPARLKAFADHMHGEFAPHGDDAFVVPRANISIAGLRVTQLFPGSVGMGIGISVTVAGKFDDAKHRLETSLGKPISRCETSDGMRSCGLPIADKRTVMIMAQDGPHSASTLIGCYYFYEK